VKEGLPAPASGAPDDDAVRGRSTCRAAVKGRCATAEACGDLGCPKALALARSPIFYLPPPPLLEAAAAASVWKRVMRNAEENKSEKAAVVFDVSFFVCTMRNLF
jgi:hypothetical protein